MKETKVVELFKFEDDNHFNDVRTVQIKGKVWFVGADIANVLGYKNSRKTLNDHCRKKGVTKRYPLQTIGGVQFFTLINEPNVYRLITKSKLPSAERFEEWLFEEVLPEIRKKGYYGAKKYTPLRDFIKRYNLNWNTVPPNYFSVINLLYNTLYKELERVGYILPDIGEHGKQMMPDISVGRGFAKYLRENQSEFYNTHKSYAHRFDDGRTVQANMYMIDAIPVFIRYVLDSWLPQSGEQYFKKRDPKALAYLPKLLKAA